jgi:hypothetical protein
MVEMMDHGEVTRSTNHNCEQHHDANLKALRSKRRRRTCAKFSLGTLYRSSTAASTFLLDTLMPTSALLSPTREKKDVMAASSSASASTPAK